MTEITEKVYNIEEMLQVGKDFTEQLKNNDPELSNVYGEMILHSPLKSQENMCFIEALKTNTTIRQLVVGCIATKEEYTELCDELEQFFKENTALMANIIFILFIRGDDGELKHLPEFHRYILYRKNKEGKDK